MDKQTESRKEFEAWWQAAYEKSYDKSKVNSLITKPVAWTAWQASRESLVVELPETHAHLIWIQAGRGPDDYWDDVEISRSEKDKCCDGSDRYEVYAKWQVEELFRAIGIRIKGEGV